MGGKPTTTLTFPEPNIALITLDNPDRSANILAQPTLKELEQHFDTLQARNDVHGLILCSGKPGMFIAGADIGEFVASMEQPGDHRSHAEAMCRKGQALFARLSAMPFVTVAAIDGVCMGGGTEISLWCDRRIASNSPRAEIGLPEVKIGLIPGWGGTVRLPRIAGLSNAIEMITSGETVSAAAALQLGIVSAVVNSDKLLSAAIGLVKLEHARGGYLKDRQRWQQPIKLSPTELAFLKVTAGAMISQLTQGNYPAPVVALETMLETHNQSIEKACEVEAQGLAKLFGGEANRALMNVFFITDRNKKDQGAVGGSAPAKIQTVGVIGAGIMGSGIAGAHLKRKLNTFLSDTMPEALSKGVRGTLEEVSFDKASKAPNPKQLLEFAPLLKSTSDLSELSDCDLVIEAVVEKLEVKKQLFNQLEAVLRPDAILASNTSTIPITELAKGLKHPERFCGIHYFNPVRRMMLVEVIRGPQSSDATIASAVAHVKKLGKFPVVVQDGPGFLVNRLLFPYMNEALQLLAEGVPMDAIDKAAKKFGLPMGPLELHDMVGLDTALYAGGVMHDKLPERMIDTPILAAMVNAGRLGNKSGQGFYSYKNKKGKRTADPAVQELLKPFIKSSGNQPSGDALTARLILPMLLEASDVLDAGLVRDARDVDLGLIYGIGFPPFKGGLLFWADRQGIGSIMKMLEPLAAVGPRFAPTKYLKELAASGKSFYQKSQA
ncbi:MAG: enoyl-CoA hydratase/isomerase family protein [Pirellulaceae bacterium]|nr:enoyl-CoA hydratase/isomerase family protein [Pirellulaceae bacterium]